MIDCLSRNDAPMLNESYFPKDVFGSMAALTEAEGFKYPHLQLRGLSCTRGEDRVLEAISLEARGGEIIAVLATKSRNLFRSQGRRKIHLI